MSLKRIVASLLIVAGTLGLVYRTITYTKETHDAKLGPLKFSVKEKEQLEIPVWLSVGLVAVGGAVLLFDRRR